MTLPSLFDNPERLNRLSLETLNLENLRKLFAANKAIYIPGNVPSLKNSRRIFTRKRKSGEDFTVNMPSVVVESYIHASRQSYINNKPLFRSLTKGLSEPYIIGMYFIRDSQTLFDYTGCIETIADIISGRIIFFNSGEKWRTPAKNEEIQRPLFTIDDKQYTIKDRIWNDNFFSSAMRSKVRWIDDDNANIFRCIPLGHGVNKAKAGVIMVILDNRFLILFNKLCEEILAE